MTWTVTYRFICYARWTSEATGTPFSCISTYIKIYIHTHFLRTCHRIDLNWKCLCNTHCIHTHTDGMSWVNFNFKFMSTLRKCKEAIEVDVYSTVVTTIGVLFGTFCARTFVNDYLVKWWIRRKVSNVCLSVCDLRHAQNFMGEIMFYSHGSRRESFHLLKEPSLSLSGRLKCCG
jgi:hypothetical protein